MLSDPHSKYSTACMFTEVETKLLYEEQKEILGRDGLVCDVLSLSIRDSLTNH